MDLNKELLAGSVGITGAILPRDRNLAGIDIDVIVARGLIGMMVIDPNIMPDNNAFILDFTFIQPVFTNIPGWNIIQEILTKMQIQRLLKVFIWKWIRLGSSFIPSKDS